MAEEILLTREGYDKLEAERDELVTVKRKEISEKLKEARSYGDLSENAEYDAAKDEQAELEDRILKLDEMLRNAKIINEDEEAGDTVNVGLVVTVRNTKTRKNAQYAIVGKTETDPFAQPPRISNESVIGKALINRKVGETVEVPIPTGLVRYKILGVTKQK
jgi:transcription elongation factor GreA